MGPKGVRGEAPSILEITYFVISYQFLYLQPTKSIIITGAVCVCTGGFFAAYYNDGWRVLKVGGNWNNGGKAGLFYFNANNTASNSNTNVGARLLDYSSLRRLLLTAW